jgi:hypothetical protein
VIRDRSTYVDADVKQILKTGVVYDPRGNDSAVIEAAQLSQVQHGLVMYVENLSRIGSGDLQKRGASVVAGVSGSKVDAQSALVDWIHYG